MRQCLLHTRRAGRSNTLVRSLCSADGVKPLLRSDYTPPSFLIPEINLHFELDANETIIKSKLLLSRQTADADLVLDGEHMTLRSLMLDGTVLNDGQFSVGPSTLVVPHATLPKGDSFVLEAEVAVRPKENLSCAGLYMDGGGSFMTQVRPRLLSVHSKRICALHSVHSSLPSH